MQVSCAEYSCILFHAKKLCKKTWHTLQKLVKVDLARFRLQVSWASVTAIAQLLFVNSCVKRNVICTLTWYVHASILYCSVNICVFCDWVVDWLTIMRLQSAADAGFAKGVGPCRAQSASLQLGSGAFCEWLVWKSTRQSHCDLWHCFQQFNFDWSRSKAPGVGHYRKFSVHFPTKEQTKK